MNRYELIAVAFTCFGFALGVIGLRALFQA